MRSHHPYEMMMPLDFGERKRGYITDRLAAAGFVVLVSCKEGILMATTNNKIKLRKKIFEVHYKMAGARIGEINAVNKLGELIMNAADGMHMNEAMPDVNALAKALSDHFSEVFTGTPQPIMFKFMLAEVGKKAEEDIFIEIRCDGSLEDYKRFCFLGEVLKEKNSTGRQSEPLSERDLKNIAINAPKMKKASEGLEELFAAKAAAKEEVCAKDVMRLITGADVWSKEVGKLEAAILLREPIEGDERHFKRLSKEDIQEMIS